MKPLFVVVLLVTAVTTATAQPGTEAPPPEAPSEVPVDPSMRDKLGSLMDRAKAKLDRYNITAEVAKRLAQHAVGRARRGIAVGPLVGGYGQIDAKDSVSGGGLSFGLGLYMWETPVGLRLREVIEERVKAELRARMLEGKDIDGDQLIADIIEQVIRDVLDGGAGSQTLRPSKGSIVLEGFAQLGDVSGFGARLKVGAGLGRINLGLIAGVAHANDTTTALFGAEVSMHLTPIGQKRTPVFDIFARVELGARDELPVHGAIGARVLLDVL